MYTNNQHRVTYSPIGIDIGSRSVNIVQLAKSSEDLHIHEADIMMLPSEKVLDAGTIKDALSDLIKRNNFKGKTVVSRMPPSLVSIIPVKISPREGELLEQAIVREAKEHITYPVEEAVIDYLPISNSAEGSDESRKVLLILVKRCDVISYMDLFRKAGLKVDAIDIGPNAIRRAVSIFIRPLGKRIMIINIGDENSFSTILWDDSILIDRKMGWGERNIIEMLVSNLDIDHEEARKILFKYGIDCSSTPFVFFKDDTYEMPDENIPAHIFDIVSPCMEELNKEIEKMLIYCTSEMKGTMIDQIYLMGSGGFIRYLNLYLQKSFGFDVRLLEPEGIFTHTKDVKRMVKDNLTTFITAIGLALRGYDA